MPISGTVYDPSGTAQSGAPVVIVNSDTDSVVAELTTDASGTFSYEPSVSGTYHVATQYDDGAGGQFNADSYPQIQYEAPAPAFWDEANHRYQFSEGTGTTVADTGSAASLADLTLTGGTWTTDAIHEGWAVDFDGVDDYGEAPNRSTMAGFGTDGFTILGWWYVPSSVSTRRTFASLYDTTGDNRSWLIEYRGDESPTTIHVNLSPDGANFYSHKWDVSWADEWQRMAVRWVPDQQPDVAINGQFLTQSLTATTISQIYDPATPMWIADAGYTSRFFDCIVDDFMIIPRALTDQEIQDDYNAYGV